jgi:adenylylsulfate kinase-like enzyme
MNEAGLIVLTAFISVPGGGGGSTREIIGRKRFMEVYVSTALEVCEGRDVKGLYCKTHAGEPFSFTGIYEVPEGAECEIDTGKVSVEEGVEMVITAMGVRYGD